MYKAMAELDVPVCLMHMRGDPNTMMGLKEYENNDIVAGVRYVTLTFKNKTPKLKTP